MSSAGGVEPPFAGPPPGRVAIVGAGQVGTMLGMALRAAGARGGIEGIMLIDRDPAIAEGSRARGAGDRVSASPEAALEADTIVLAMPVAEIVKWVDEVGPRVGAGRLVLDTGSAKLAVAQALRRSVPSHAHGVGGHPMAGTEVPGPAGARPELVRGAPFVLTPVRDDPLGMARARAVVDAVGARAVEMTAEEHDRAVAIASHLPHAVAFALAAAAGEAARTDALALREIVSTGFLSTTRLAGSDPGMVAGFLAANAAHVRGSIARFRTALDDLDASVEDEAALAGLLAAARSARGSLAPWEEAS